MKTIEEQLRQTWRKERRLCHIRGACRSLIWFALLLLLGFLIDYGLLFKTRMPPAMSLLLGIAAVVVLICVIHRGWIRQLKPFDPTRIALDVEAEHPELMSSLLSYTELKSAGHLSEASPELLDAMREFAVQKSSQIKFSEIIDYAEIRRLLGFAVTVLLISGACNLRWSDHLSILFKRMAGIEATYPIQTKLTEITGDFVIPYGRPVTISATAGGVIPRDAFLYVRRADDPSQAWNEVPMQKLDNGFSFSRQLPALERTLNYFVILGDYRSREYTISVVKAPIIVETELKLHMPSYLKRAVETSDQLNVEVPEGTRIDWQLHCDKPVEQMVVAYGDKKIEARIAEDGRAISFSLAAHKSFNYTFSWTEADSGRSFEFEDVEYRVKVLRDAKPTISYIGRSPDGPATVDKKVNVDWEVRDDYGLDELWLVYNVTTEDSAEKPEFKRILLQELKGQASFSSSYQWTIASNIRTLKPGMIVQYHLEVSDIKPDSSGERVARTPVNQLAIVSKGDFMEWFRRELATRNEIVKKTFLAERDAVKKLNALLSEEGVPQP